MPLLRPRVRGGDIRSKDGRIQIGAGPDKDNPVSAITQWVPIEVIAFYEGITQPFGSHLAPLLLYFLAAGIVVTFLWILFATENNGRKAWRQVILSCFAFLFWVIGTSSPETWKMLFAWWHPGIGPAALATGAVALPIIDGILKRMGIPQD